ncbi:MAG: Ig-like domain-containing protein [Verrucomicrobiota bacterium]
MRGVLLALAGVFVLTQSAWSAAFTWDPSPDANIAGYRLYYGSASGNYTQSVDVGNVTQATVANLTAGATYYAAVTAYNTAALESVKSNEVSFVAAMTPANIPPTVSLTSPVSGASYAAPANINLSATASDSDGSVTSVEFYNGTTRLAAVSAAPYTFTWTGVAAGSYPLTAKAYDNAGAVTTSAPITVTVLGATVNKPPTVSLTSPANGASFTPPATVTVSATAADSDGTITKVEFYNGTTLLATKTTSPYSVTFTGVPAGTYILTAKAYDNSGAATASAPATVNVAKAVTTANKPPTVSLTSPVGATQLKAPATITLSAAASDSDGTITKVEFYNGSSLLATKTTSPYSVTFTGVPVGTYTVTARAYDNAGASTTSAAVTVTVTL